MAKTLSKAQELAALVNAALGTKTKPASIVRMASDPSLQVTYLPTGVLPFDVLLGGGVPKGRMIEVFGDFSTLKSYVALRAIAEAQRRGETAALIDTEGAFDPKWAASLGVDVDDLIIWPDRADGEIHTGEEAFDVAQTLIMGKVGILVFDSIAAAAPKDVMSKRLSGESIQPARLAALMSEGLRRLTTVNSSAAIYFINQTRINVGVTFGSNEALPGGKAMGYYASQRIRLKKTGKVTRPRKVWDGTAYVDTKEVTGQKFVAMLEKSKLSSPHREQHFVWDHTIPGVDEVGFLVAQGLEYGEVEQKGNTWQVSGTPYKAVGRENFLTMVRTTPKASESLRDAVLAQVMPGNVTAPASGSPGSTTPRKRRVVVKRK